MSSTSVDLKNVSYSSFSLPFSSNGSSLFYFLVYVSIFFHASKVCTPSVFISSIVHFSVCGGEDASCDTEKSVVEVLAVSVHVNRHRAAQPISMEK